MCCTQEAGKRQAPGVSGHTLEGYVKANPPKAQDALHVDGHTSEGQTEASQADHSQQVLVVSLLSSYYVEGQLGGNPAQVLIDTGSALTLVHTGYRNHIPQPAPQLQPVSQCLVSVDGTPLATHGVASVEVVLGGESFSVPITVVDDITADIILGIDFL